MKLSLLSLIFPIALSACAGTFDSPPKVSKSEPVEVAQKKSETIEVERSLWTMSLPEGWVVRPGGPKTFGPVTQSLVARTTSLVGSEPVAVVVVEIALDASDPKDEEFGAFIAVGSIQSSKTKGNEVISAVPKPVDGKEGSLVMLASNKGLLVIQEAVGHKRVGFVITCGGDLKQGSKIIDTCLPIIETFHTK